jgi:hypothetical protein
MEKKDAKRISLKEASKLTGYASDYIGWLIRKGRIKGESIKLNTSWLVDSKDLLDYCQKNKKLDPRVPVNFKKKTLTLKEASSMSGYSSDYIGQLIRAGKVRGTKNFSGKSWLTDINNINSYIASKKRKDYFSLPFLPFIRIPKYSLMVAVFMFIISSGLVAWAWDPKVQTQTAEIYPSEITGDWKNIQNAKGFPQVADDGSIDFFSETNSAVYETGALSILAQNFNKSSGDDLSQNQESSEIIPPAETTEIVTSTDPVDPGLTGDKDTINIDNSIPENSDNSVSDNFNDSNQATTIEESPSPDIKINSTDTEQSLPVSFLDKVKKFFGANQAKAQQNIKFDDLVENEFIGAKIKFSFAVGEKQPDISMDAIQSQVAGDKTENQSGEQQIINDSQDQNANATESGTGEILFFDKVKNIFSAIFNKLAQVKEKFYFSIAKAQESEIIISDNSEQPVVENTIEQLTVFDEQKTTTSAAVIEEALTSSEQEIIQDNYATTEETTSSTTTLADESTATEQAVDVSPETDAKIIISWSINADSPDAQWTVLDTISNSSVSNALNNGYFSYDAWFLKNWEDAKNLRIKFEGVSGGETKFTAYLDSVWVEVEYQEKNENKITDDVVYEEPNKPGLSADIIAPDVTPEKFYLISRSGEDSGIIEPKSIEINGSKYVPWRLTENNDGLELEMKSENGTQKIVFEKNKQEYALWEDQGTGFKLKATAIPEFQFEKNGITSKAQKSIFSLMKTASAQELLFEPEAAQNESAPTEEPGLDSAPTVEQEVLNTEIVSETINSTNSDDQLPQPDSDFSATSDIDAASATVVSVENGTTEAAAQENEPEQKDSSLGEKIINAPKFVVESVKNVIQDGKTEKAKKILDKKSIDSQWGNYNFVPETESSDGLSFEIKENAITITHSYLLSDENNNLTAAKTVVKFDFSGYGNKNEWIFSQDENQNKNRFYWDIILAEKNQIKEDKNNVTEKDVYNNSQLEGTGLANKIKNIFSSDAENKSQLNESTSSEPILGQSFGDVEVGWKDYVVQDAPADYSKNEFGGQVIKNLRTRAEHIKDANALRVWFDEEGKQGALTIDPTLIIQMPTSRIAVRNVGGNNFGSATSGQWYLEFDASWGGMIKTFKSAETSPFSTIASAANLISTYSTVKQPLYDAYLSSNGSVFVGNAQGTTTEFQLLGNDPERIVVHTKSTHTVATSTLTVDAYHYVYPTGKVYVTWEVTTNFTTYTTATSSCFFRMSEANNSSNTATFYNSYPSGYVGQIYGTTTNPNIKGVTFMPYDSTFFNTSTAESNNTTQLRTSVCSGKTSLPAGTYNKDFFIFFGADRSNVNKDLAANYTHAYRTPDTLSFSTGSVWNDDGDGYNESTGAYTASFENQQISFSIDGGNNGTNTTNSVLGAASTTVSVASVSGFLATGTAYVIDNGVVDEFYYTGLDVPNNDFTGVTGLLSHSSTSLDVFQPTRYKPGLKIRNWLSLDEPNSLTVNGATTTKWTDYNMGIVQFSEAWFADYNYGSTTFAQIAAGGSNEIDPREYLDDESPGQNYVFLFNETGRNQSDILYLGAHTKFTGVNTLLRDAGVGSADLEWEYWNGSSWSHLEVADGSLGVNDLKASGYFNFSEPVDWTKTRVNNGANLYWIRGWMISGAYVGYPQERTFKTDVLNFRYLSDITSAGFNLNISAGTPVAPSGLYHLVPDSALVSYGNILAGDVTATRSSNGSRFHIATGPSGIDTSFIFKGAQLNSSNKLIVYYRGYPQTQALSYQIQICDYINTPGSSGTNCAGGNSVWRNILDHGSSNPNIALNNVSVAGAEDTFSRQFHIFNGYFTTTAGATLNTPLSDFVSNGEMKIRFVSTVTTPDLILYIDYLAVETVIDNLYSAGDYTVATGTVMTSSYADTFLQDKAGGSTCNPSIPECLWINNNNGVDAVFEFKNVATPYQGANTILVTEVGYITANSYTLSIWNASTSAWEQLNTTAYSNTSNNHHVVAKSGINPLAYITAGNEIWIKAKTTAASGNYFCDQINVTIGSTNSSGLREISLGTNTNNTATATASIDNSTAADVYWSASSSLANSVARTSTMYSDDAIGTLVTEYGVAANIDLPVTPPVNSIVTEVVWAARWAPTLTTIRTSLALSTYSRSWRQQVGATTTNVQTFQMGVYGSASPYSNSVPGVVTQSNTNSFAGPLHRPFTTAASDAFANPWMEGPGFGLPTSGTAGNAEAVATWESIDPNSNSINLRIRTQDSTVSSAGGGLNWDFAFVTIRYWDGGHPTLKAKVTAQNGGYVVGTSTTSNWRFTKDDFSAAAPFVYSWAASDSAAALDLYLVMATTTIPSSANKIIINTRAAASAASPDISFMICDFATSTGVYGTTTQCNSPGGWRVINHARWPYDFSAANTQNYFQFEIYDGYFTASVSSLTPISTPISNFFQNGAAKIRVLERGGTSNLSFYWEFCQLELAASNNYFPAGFATSTSATVESGGFISLVAPDGSGTGACIHTDSNASNTCHGITSTAGQTLNFYYPFKVATPYQGANAIFIDTRINNSSASAAGQLRIYNFSTGLWEVLNTGDLDAAATTLYRFQFIKQVNNWADYISGGEMRIGYYSPYTTSFTVRFDYLEVYLGSVINSNTVSDVTSGSIYDGDPFNTDNLDTTQTYSETTYPNITWRISGFGKNSATFDGASSQASSLKFPMSIPTNGLPTDLVWIVKAGVDSTSFDQRVRLKNFSGDYDIAYDTKVTFPAGVAATGPLAASAGVGGMEVYYFDGAITANAAPYKGYYVLSPERYFDPIDNSVRLQLHTFSLLYATRGLFTWDAAFVSMNSITQ